jgi:hypothetical protein
MVADTLRGLVIAAPDASPVRGAARSLRDEEARHRARAEQLACQYA